MGAKIGIGVTVPFLLILLGIVGFFVIRRRKQRTTIANHDLKLHESTPPEYPSGFKAELQETNTPIVSPDALEPVAPKAELQAATFKKTSSNDVKFSTVPELESLARMQEEGQSVVAPDTRGLSELQSPPVSPPNMQPIWVPELGSGARTREYAPREVELDTQRPAHLSAHASPTDPFAAELGAYMPKRKEVPRQHENTGPLATPEEFVARSEADVDDELAYQERKLRERREILAEKERIAQEEEELRRRRMSRMIS